MQSPNVCEKSTFKTADDSGVAQIDIRERIDKVCGHARKVRAPDIGRKLIADDHRAAALHAHPATQNANGRGLHALATTGIPNDAANP